ncbi:lipocalin-like [Latimeria chalumnae]|uniref:lipocalin-like n=1 Tax=Latimeria chalumnae TaxID=7897 RepID=UPI0003C17114|nr:PREDICTED: lipocalin-like [Latimeria chalumnae]|eukprot:XP_005994504.1 PREDICTED: lipocalin-like [Latimeria chalumnae]
MKAVLFCAGMVLVCALRVKADVPVQKDFDINKIVGKWRLVAAASDSEWFKTKKETLKGATTVFTLNESGNLDVRANHQRPEGCVEMNRTYSTTEQPGRFTYTNPEYGSVNDIRVVDTNYDDYALMYFYTTKDIETFHKVKLYGRTLDLKPEIVDKFKQFCITQGFTQDTMFILPKNDECTPTES